MTRAMNYRCVAAASWLLVLALPALHSQTEQTPPEPETVTLAYSPPDGSLFEISGRLETTTGPVGGAMTTDVSERLTRMLITCLDDDTYANTGTIVSETLTRNGNPVPSPVYAAMAGLRLTYTLAKDGSLTSVTGYEQLPEAMAEKLAPPVAAAMTSLVNVGALQERDRKFYHDLYLGVLGAEMQVGVPVTKAEIVPLPRGGHVPVYSVLTLTRDPGEGGALRLTETRSSDAGALASEFEDIESEALEAKATEAGLTAMLPEDLASASVGGSDVTVVDLGGILIGSRTTRTEYTLTPKVSEGETATSTTFVQTLTVTSTPVEQTPAPANAPPS